MSKFVTSAYSFHVALFQFLQQCFFIRSYSFISVRFFYWRLCIQIMYVYGCKLPIAYQNLWKRLSLCPLPHIKKYPLSSVSKKHNQITRNHLIRTRRQPLNDVGYLLTFWVPLTIGRRAHLEAVICKMVPIRFLYFGRGKWIKGVFIFYLKKRFKKKNKIYIPSIFEQMVEYIMNTHS